MELSWSCRRYPPDLQSIRNQVQTKDQTLSTITSTKKKKRNISIGFGGEKNSDNKKRS